MTQDTKDRIKASLWVSRVTSLGWTPVIVNETKKCRTKEYCGRK